MTDYTDTLEFSAESSLFIHQARQYFRTASFRSTGEMAVTPTKPTISDPLVTRPEVELSFSVNPRGDPVTFVLGETLYSPPDAYYTEINDVTTFIASLNFHDETGMREATEYLWHFGDGVRAWGQTVSHVYTYVNTFTQATLRVTDDLGRRFYTRQQIYLTIPLG